MARKREPKRTEKPVGAIEEFPRDPEELTSTEAEAVQGGSVALAAVKGALAVTTQETATGLIMKTKHETVKNSVSNVR